MLLVWLIKKIAWHILTSEQESAEIETWLLPQCIME